VKHVFTDDISSRQAAYRKYLATKRFKALLADGTLVDPRLIICKALGYGEELQNSFEAIVQSEAAWDAQ
jgi:hypothetical protein